MRSTASSAGPTGLPTRFSLFGAVVASLAVSLAVVVGALAVGYPAVTGVFLAGALGALVVTGVVRRASVTRRTPRPVLAVRVPFTRLQLEV